MGNTVKTKKSSYEVWRNMKQRCLNPNNKDFKHYGGRGISICEEWRLFENFYKDMGEKPPGLQIDRVDNEVGYFKENCKWTTPTKNMLNRRGKLNKNLGLARGVSKSHNRFIARIQINEFTYHIGSYMSEKMASDAFGAVFHEWYGKSAVEVFNE